MKKKIKPRTEVHIGDLVLKNPILTASGTFGYGLEFEPFFDLDRLGGIVVKGLSLKPRYGNPPPRTCETASGMLNAVGLENIGVDAFIEEKLPLLKEYSCAIIANIFGEHVEEYEKITRRLCDAGGVSAIEVNVSCPNTDAGGMHFGIDPEITARVTRSVREASTVPVIVKLSPNVTDIKVIARAAEAAGADALSLVNTFVGMAVDACSRKPILANRCGGLSGPAIKPLALWLVYQVVNSVRIPVIGMGGISSIHDVLEFLIVGARAIQVGTANFIEPSISGRLVDELEKYLLDSGIPDVNSVIGSLIAA
ncbi:MAG: dihydroorotate dehydrogenase [Acidobacteriota bacterium]